MDDPRSYSSIHKNPHFCYRRCVLLAKIEKKKGTQTKKEQRKKSNKMKKKKGKTRYTYTHISIETGYYLRGRLIVAIVRFIDWVGDWDAEPSRMIRSYDLVDLFLRLCINSMIRNRNRFYDSSRRLYLVSQRLNKSLDGYGSFISKRFIRFWWSKRWRNSILSFLRLFFEK